MEGKVGVMFENGPEAQKFGLYLWENGVVDFNPTKYQGMKVFYAIDDSTSIERLERLIVELSRWNPSDEQWSDQ
jgi:hypothetical protein